MRIILSAVLAAGAILAQELRIETFHGRQAFVLENRHIRVSALRGGGHLAEIRFRSGDAARTVNPMRVPHYQTIEPYQYDPRRHDALYGSDSHRWLSSGYMGHLLCFPVFGAPSSPAEVRSGLGNHGDSVRLSQRRCVRAYLAKRSELPGETALSGAPFKVTRSDDSLMRAGL